MQKEKNSVSDLSAIIVDKNTGERIIFFNRDANENLEIFPEKIEKADWFFVSALNGSRHTRWEDNLRKILGILKRGIRLAYNPGPENIKTNIEAVLEACRVAEVILVNKDEAIEIVSEVIKNKESYKANINEEKFLIRSLKDCGAKKVALTDGKRGAWAIDENGIYVAQALTKKPLETTGAGDAFSSAFLGAILKEKSLEEALKWGMINSGNSVKFFGAHAGLLSEEEIQSQIGKVKTARL